MTSADTTFGELDESESDDDTGEDTQLRFHYQAQRIAALAICLIQNQSKYARIYCELHDDGLIKHFDGTYTAYQVKSRERGQPKFRATEKVVLKTIRNFLRLNRKFGHRIKKFVIASNHPFVGDESKNDLKFILKLICDNCEPSESAPLSEFVQSFRSKHEEFTESELLAVLRRIRVHDDEPDFSAALGSVVDELRKVPDIASFPENYLWDCARALVSKVEACSRKQVASDDVEEESHTKSSVRKKLLTAEIVWDVLQSALRKPLGTSFRRISILSAPVEYLPVIKSAFVRSADSLKSTKRKLTDGTKFIRGEQSELIKRLSSTDVRKILLLLGEPGAGKSAVLAGLCDELLAQGVAALVVKCEDIPKNVQDQSKLAEFLALPYEAVACITAVAEFEPVMLVIDQLDAVGALWDTQTARMQTILALVHTASRIPNVRVILSCREFDAHFDVRVSHLDAEKVHLSLPTSEEIQNVLLAHGLNCTQWPADIIEVLRNPQHLDIFVSLLKDCSNQIEVVKNYFDLLGLLWSQRVLPEDEPVLSKLCDTIEDRKQLFVSSAALFAYKKQLERLSGAGVLTYTDNKNKIGFAHQTLYEYCLARTFVQSDKSFSKYVLKQQHSLHARPMIWSCLHYLRDCDIGMYEREILLLLQNGALRAHIKSLIFQFLTQVSAPTVVEKTSLLRKISAHEVSDLDLIELCKNPEWIDVLLPTYIPSLMKDVKKSDLACRILANGCAARQQQVVLLLQQHWFDDAERDRVTLMVLWDVRVWNSELCSALCKIMVRSNSDHLFLEQLMRRLSERSPKLAPPIVAFWLKQQYILACRHPKMNFQVPTDIPEEQRYVWLYQAEKDDPRLKEISSIIEGKRRFYLPEIAKRTPTEFVESVWPLFREMLEDLAKEKDVVTNSYLSDRAQYTGQKLSTLAKEKYSLVSLFAELVPLFAKQNPDRYELFVSENLSSELLYVHRLLCLGLAEVVEQKTQLALNYLLFDDRRLMIGDAYDRSNESIALIRLLSPQLTNVDLQALEQRILNWQMYNSAVILGEFAGRETEQRKRRLRLLSAIPKEQRTPELEELIQSEMLIVPDFEKQLISEPEVQLVASPMSFEQMAERSDAEVQSVFKSLTDDCEENPNDWRLGGVYEASGELEKLAQGNPKKSLAVAASFVPSKNSVAVTYLMRGLGYSDEISFDELQDVIENFSSRGFVSLEFLSSVASALSHRLQQNRSFVLRSTTVKLLESAVQALSAEPVHAQQQPKSQSGSILWCAVPFQTIPTEGLYPLLVALTENCFNAEVPDLNRWVEVITGAVTVRHDPWTWQSFALTELWRLNQVVHVQARKFLETLFQRQPEVLSCPSGMVMLSYVMGVFESEELSEIVDRIGRSDWNLREQARGELAAQNYFVHGTAWSRKLIEAGLKNQESCDLAIGIAYGVGIAWVDARYRKNACKIIEQLVSLQSEEVNEALASTMLQLGELSPDEETFWLIDLLCRKPELFRQGFARVVEALPPLMLWDPERVYELLKAFTLEAGKDFLNHGTEMPMFAEHVVNATLTLQRIPGFEVKALELFEEQMALEMNEAHKVITEIDRLPKLASLS